MIVEPDFARFIDIAGAGPCRRPIDIDRGRTGSADLVSLRIYAFEQGMTIDGEAEADEVFVVAMRGRAEVRVERAGAIAGVFALDAAAGSRAMYLAPHDAYRLTAETDCAIAYARSTPGDAPPAASGAFGTGAARLDIAGHAAGMNLTLARLDAGETLALDPAPERFVHVRTGDGATAIVAQARLGDWQAAWLDGGDRVTINAEGDNIDVLVVSAAVNRTERTGRTQQS